jgi:hypothetical protein
MGGREGAGQLLDSVGWRSAGHERDLRNGALDIVELGRSQGTAWSNSGHAQLG